MIICSYLTDILTEEEYSQLSLAYLQKSKAKEYKFWHEFWQSKNISINNLENLTDYIDKIMSYAAFLSFHDVMGNQETPIARTILFDHPCVLLDVEETEDCVRVTALINKIPVNYEVYIAT